jgi:hypothetical protein
LFDELAFWPILLPAKVDLVRCTSSENVARDAFIVLIDVEGDERRTGYLVYLRTRSQASVTLARVFPMVDLRAAFLDERIDDSRRFVALSERPSTPYTPSRCNVSISSRPSSNLAVAD